MKAIYFLIIILLSFIFSCGNSEDNKNIPKFEEILVKNNEELQKNPQFIIDKLELIYISQNRLNENVENLLNSLPAEYDIYKKIFSFLITGKESDFKPTEQLFEILSKYQDNPFVLKYIAKLFSQENNKLTQDVFFFLYANNYAFSSEDLVKFSKNNGLTTFIELNLKEIELLKITNTDLVYDNPEAPLVVRKMLYENNSELLKDIKVLQKDIIKEQNSGKTAIFKLQKENLKLKKQKKSTEENDTEISSILKKTEIIKDIQEEIDFYNYFMGNNNRLNVKNKDEIALYFFKYKTPINNKILAFLFDFLKKQPFPVKLTFYKYLLEKTPEAILKKNGKFIEKLIDEKEYEYLKYAFYKKYLTDKFVMLDKITYQTKFFVNSLLIDNLKHYTAVLLNEPKENYEILKLFLYNPDLIAANFDKLYIAYTTDLVGKFSIEGKENHLYQLLKIAIKGKIAIKDEYKKQIKQIKLLYFKEIAKYFQ